MSESEVSDLKKDALLIPSKVSASNPEPAPSTVFIRVNISEAVWSAVALLSIPSNFVPSVATSRPSTVPDTAMFHVTSMPVEVVKNFLSLR